MHAALSPFPHLAGGVSVVHFHSCLDRARSNKDGTSVASWLNLTLVTCTRSPPMPGTGPPLGLVKCRLVLPPRACKIAYDSWCCKRMTLSRTSPATATYMLYTYNAYMAREGMLPSMHVGTAHFALISNITELYLHDQIRWMRTAHICFTE